MLPDGFYWLDCPEASYLRYGHGCAAYVMPGNVTIDRGMKGKPRLSLEGRCG